MNGVVTAQCVTVEVENQNIARENGAPIGTPCVFPFLYKNVWRYSCVTGIVKQANS